MLFCHGEKKSFSFLVRALKTFEKVSGLVANSEKTAVYCGSMDSTKKEETLGSYDFIMGDFPFKYLGIPLNAKYMLSSDFDSVVDKMLARITCWSSRNLSYAARATLINFVLMSLHLYWAQCILLPKGVMHRITQLCRSFLWDGAVVLGGAPPISWDWVCKPKKYGGIGVRDCSRWNKAALGKYVWKIAKKEDTLWVKWLHSIYLKDQDWWSYSPKKSDGWFWRELCAVKDELRQGFEIGNWISKNYKISDCYDWLQGPQEKTIANWLGIAERNFRLNVSWKHWKRQGMDMIHKRVYLAAFSACGYYIWFARNHAFWEKAFSFGGFCPITCHCSPCVLLVLVLLLGFLFSTGGLLSLSTLQGTAAGCLLHYSVMLFVYLMGCSLFLGSAGVDC
ncbi:uncharacterized protein LOC110704204 [Chenopodium quinoa]|uniref:uncharacterized protein LOC110704204 n=1 Tax=Chenopodium quinoa TaxID=63459 RepID=UPI000B7908BB|nr:uncharacterized protein LOC110704204 [Chenopodium quinoa]